MKHRAEGVSLRDGARGVGGPPGRHAAVRSDDELETSPYDVADTASWRSRHLGRMLLTVSAVLALGVTVPEAISYWHLRTELQLQELMVVVTFAIGLWSILASCPPQEVSVDGSVLRVRGPGVDDSFDLADALQRVELSGDPRKRRWSVTLGRLDDRELVLTRRDVSPVQLDPIVRHHRFVAERRREREWARLGL
jgi:hypothetical protein